MRPSLNRREAKRRGRQNACFYFLQIYVVKCPDFFQILLPHTQSTLAFGNDAKLASRQRGFPRYVSTASLSPTTADNCALTLHNGGFPLLALKGNFQHIYLIPNIQVIKGWQPP